MQWISLIGPILEEVLSLAGSATTGQAQNIINMLDRFISLAINFAPSLLAPIQNIIAALSGNGNVTPDQITTLQAQSASVDAALDAAAAADGLSRV